MAEITRLDQVTEYPLCWPASKPRSAQRQSGSAFKTDLPTAEREVAEEMGRWRALGFVISMSPKHRLGSPDPGVALWWRMPRPRNVPGPENLRVLACDNWPWPAHNLHAIALTLKGLRAAARYGTYTEAQAIEGARAFLPAPPRPEGPPWWEVIGVERDWPLRAIEAVWKTRLDKAHPDRGGAQDEAAVLNAAIDAARAEKNG